MSVKVRYLSITKHIMTVKIKNESDGGILHKEYLVVSH